jgi:colanic acid biosynthesis glycosyl transferase WcaI
LTRRPSRPRLLVFNQYYHPGVEATAHLLTELCEDLARDHDVTVITGRLRDHEDEPDYETRNGVEIIRVHSTSFDRAPLTRRALNYFTYLGRALHQGLKASRPDVVLCMTDPPMVGDVAWVVARRRRVPLVVISQDVFPEIAVKLGRLTNPVLVRLLDVLTRFYLRRADRVIAIGETMRRRLEEKGVRSQRLRVISNWIDTAAITPADRANGWAHEHGLVDRFVVMHSGNVGHSQNLDMLVRATTFLRDLDDLAVVIIGGGARRGDLMNLVDLLEADAVSFLDYQPRDTLSLSLSAAHLHYIGLGRGLSGYVVPSRLYGVLSAGRPVLVAADGESETAAVVRTAECGIVVPPNRPELVAEAIRAAYDGGVDLDGMGRRGREYVVAEADSSIAIERYRRVLRELASS